ncbi:MAG: exodeoxyribonuclease VII large subunit [Bacteroidetes bacterium]|nr:MAG: exodeoxyribonuclease VII large subunit [Bacteroidota bacterium]
MPETFEYRNKTQKYYSLGELTGSIRKVIAKAYTSAYWVKTEIAKLNFYPYSGHCYPDLVEKQNNKVVAQIRSTIWSGTFDAITKKFRQATGENLSEGMTVLFLVRVVYHEQHGLSLNILDVEPSFTLGEMAREKQQAIQRLKKEGLFDLNKQLAFPLLPKNIAVISVETSKGYHDFLNILQNNRYGYHFEQTLFPALLQGEGAVKSIVQQLKAIAHYTGRFDVVVIIRGGGGDVGLSAYNNYTLAKEVAGFPLPVITGIGHATNETVTEMITFANKITPTDVAYFLIEKFEHFHALVYNLEEKLKKGSSRFLAKQTEALNSFTGVFNQQVRFLVEQNKGRLQLYQSVIASLSRRFLATEKNNLLELITHLQYKPVGVILHEKEKISRLNEMLLLLSKQNLKNQAMMLQHLESRLKLLKPENVLKRGYSITRLNKKALKHAGEAKPGDTIITVLSGGKIESTITKINKNE